MDLEGTPKVKQRKKNIKRLRTGCWTCRRRGYKCDEGKPECANCTRLKIKCEGYGIRLKWQNTNCPHRTRNSKGSIHRSANCSSTRRALRSSSSELDGEVIGAIISTSTTPLLSPQLSWTPSSSPVTSLSISPTPLVTVHETNNIIPPTAPLPPPPAAATTPPPDPEFCSSVSPDTASRDLVDYYARYLTSDVGAFRSSNAYQVILDMMNGNDPIRLGICCLSACSLAHQNVQPQLSTLSVQFKVMALHSLRQHLEFRSFDVCALAAGLLLSLQEVLECNFDGWRKHLDGIAHGLFASQMVTQPTIRQDTRVRPLLRELLYNDVMSTITSGLAPAAVSFDISYWTSDLNLDFTGSSCHLIHYAAMVSSVATRLTQIVPPVNFLQGINMPMESRPIITRIPYSVNSWPQGLLESKRNIESLIRSWKCPPTAGVDDQQTLWLLKYALDLYFLLRLDVTEYGLQLSHNIVDVVSNAIETFKQVSSTSQSTHLHLWPLYQVGMVCEKDEHRDVIVDRLQIYRTQNPRHRLRLDVILDTLKDIWSYRDSPISAGCSYRELIAMGMKGKPVAILY